MQKNGNIPLRHQQFMLAVRHEMGWPAFRPANDAIAFCTGREMNFEVGAEMARITQMLRKDAIYTGWANSSAALPTSFTIVYRELLAVDIVDRVVPFAASEDAPIVFVSTRADEIFGIDRRGAMVRVPGKPKTIGTGRRLAMKRIKVTAATMGDTLLEGNRFLARGAEWIEPADTLETVVRFS